MEPVDYPGGILKASLRKQDMATHCLTAAATAQLYILGMIMQKSFLQRANVSPSVIGRERRRRKMTATKAVMYLPITA